MSLLKLEHINTGYGKKQVLFDVNLEVQEGETLLLVGANGSGKSTLFKCIMGLLPCWHQDSDTLMQFDHDSILGEAISCRIKAGILYIPQTNAYFEDLSVIQNLENSILHSGDRHMIRTKTDEILESMPLLRSLSKRSASRLSGGERKLLSIGMVKCNNPTLVLFDEPLAGVSAANTDIILSEITTLKKQGATIVSIEHQAKELLPVSDRVLGMKLGSLKNENLTEIETVKQFLI